MEGRHPPGLFVALTDCTEVSREAEFNRWYNEAFIPDMETLGFIRNTRRYENVRSNEPTFQGRPKYLALSEVYREDLIQALKDIRQFYAHLKAQGKWFGAMVAKVETLFQRVGPEFRTERSGRPVRGVFFVMTYCTDSTREEEYDRWYEKRHAPEFLEGGHHDSGYRYKVVDPDDPSPHQSVPYLAVYETSMDPSLAQEAITKYREACLSDPIWVRLLNVFYAGEFRLIYSR